MNRRTVLKNLALVLGGAVLLPACMHPDGTNYVQLKHIQLTDSQQDLIADIADTIIPHTNTPGAKDLKLPAFIIKMFDDCYGKEGQIAIFKGIEDFVALVNKSYSKTFVELSTREKEDILNGLEKAANTEESSKKAAIDKSKPSNEIKLSPLSTFYREIKRQTIFAYTTSQYFMTKQIVYELIPGRYNAHFPVKNVKTA